MTPDDRIAAWEAIDNFCLSIPAYDLFGPALPALRERVERAESLDSFSVLELRAVAFLAQRERRWHGWLPEPGSESERQALRVVGELVRRMGAGAFDARARGR
ncbi:MAG TPA: hypothetical protein VHB21_11430 [Minicystis sp.]|nr:hypothetical protein [Minicystis sp.]